MSRAVSSGALRAVASRLASAPAASASRPAPRFAFGRAQTHSRPSFDAPPRDFRAPAWAPLVDACRPASARALRRAPPSFAASAGATRGLSGKAKRFVSDGKTSKSSAASRKTLPEPPPRAAARAEPPRADVPASSVPDATVAVDGMPRFPDASVPGALRLSDYVGTATFAVTGSLAAAARGMDVLGATVVGTITAVGGGTIRDVLLGRGRRAFWMEEPEYLWICVVSAAGAFLAWPHLEEAFGVRVTDPWVEYLDALGVGAFCVIGAQNGARAGVPCAAAVACGMFTATFGGVVRDVLMERPVRILHSYTDVYATTALGGASAYMLIRAAGAPVSLRIIGGVAVAVAARVAAARNDWRLPTYAGPTDASATDATSETLDTRSLDATSVKKGRVRRNVGFFRSSVASVPARGERNAPNARESDESGKRAPREKKTETRRARRVPSGALAAAEKGDDGSGARPALAGYVATAFRAIGM